MKKTIVCIAAMSMMYISSVAQENKGRKLTLQQCIATALTNNTDARQAELLAETAAVNLKQAKANALPDLFGNVGHGLSQGRSIDPFTNNYLNREIAYGNYSISSGVVLYNGSQVKNLIQQNNLATQAAKLDAQQVKDNVTVNVILAYLQVLNNEDLLVQARSQGEVTRQQVGRLTTLDKVGAVAPASLYDLKGQQATDELAIINSENALKNAKLSLAQLMNVPFDNDVQVEKFSADFYVADKEVAPATVYQTALTQLPLTKAAELRTQVARKGIQVAKGNYYPLVSLSGSINTNYSNAARREVLLNSFETASGDFVNFNGSKVPVMTQQSNYASQTIPYFDQFTNNYNTSLFLNVRVPILNGARAKNRVALAKIDLKNAEYASYAAKTQLNQTVEQAVFNLDAAATRMKTLDQQVKDFSESFRIAEVRFNAGAITQVDYLVAKNNVDRPRINFILAKYDYVYRSKVVDYYNGKLSSLQ
jgi:outer membrane protein